MSRIDWKTGTYGEFCQVGWVCASAVFVYGRYSWSLGLGKYGDESTRYIKANILAESIEAAKDAAEDAVVEIVAEAAAALGARITWMPGGGKDQ